MTSFRDVTLVAMAALPIFVGCTDGAYGDGLDTMSPPDARAPAPVECEPTTRVLQLTPSTLYARPGEPVVLDLHFDALPQSSDLRVLVDFVAANGATAPLVTDRAPPVSTSTWSGAVSYAMRTEPVPPSVAPGTYSIRVSLARAAPPYDRIVLGQGEGVTGDEQRRYTVGTLTIGAR